MRARARVLDGAAAVMAATSDALLRAQARSAVSAPPAAAAAARPPLRAHIMSTSAGRGGGVNVNRLRRRESKQTTEGGERVGGGAHGISRTRDKGGPSPRRTGEMGGGGGGARGRDEIQGRQHGWRSQPTMQRLCSNPILIVNTRNGQTRNSSFFEVVCLIVCIVGGVFVWCIV